MSLIPQDVGPIHFIGIGGIGMSGIAEVLLAMGYTVRGSDLTDNANVQRLRAKGIEVAVGHDAANLGDARVIVFSSAVKADNPELQAAREQRLPVVRRADMLAELMRLKKSIAVAGTHGKTTTTAMVGALLDAAGLDPTVVNGGIINAYGTNVRLGRSDWMVVESDESDGSFLRLPATIGIVTNIDPEHMEFWGNFEAVKSAYYSFVERLPFYGFGVLCIDHPEVQALLPRITDRRVVTYGMSPQADVQASEVRIHAAGSTFDVTLHARPGQEERRLLDVRLSLPGQHNVQNALAALTIGIELAVPEATIRAALAGLQGVKRRFTRTGSVDGITVIDDYAHHPEEIRAVLRTARAAAPGRILAVMQPHRYSRLQGLFEAFCTCFAEADLVLVAPVYAAGEPPIQGIDRESLVAGLRAHGQREVIPIADEQELLAQVSEHARAGDYVLCMGAGSISQWANQLPQALASRRGTVVE